MSLTLCSTMSPLALCLILHTGLHPMTFRPLGILEGGTSVHTWHAFMDLSSFVSPCAQYSLSCDAMATLQFLGSQALLFTRVAKAQSGSLLSTALISTSGLAGGSLCALVHASL